MGRFTIAIEVESTLQEAEAFAGELHEELLTGDIEIIDVIVRAE
jgi:hypothetical protein